MYICENVTVKSISCILPKNKFSFKNRLKDIYLSDALPGFGGQGQLGYQSILQGPWNGDAGQYWEAIAPSTFS